MSPKLHEFAVTLQRDGQGTPWGIRLVGGNDLDTPLIITRVKWSELLAHQLGLHYVTRADAAKSWQWVASFSPVALWLMSPQRPIHQNKRQRTVHYRCQTALAFGFCTT